MNSSTGSGPCTGYEHVLIDLLEGALPPGEARAACDHLAACPRCRAWQADFAALDARLAHALPRPELPGNFAARVRERIAAETRRVPAEARRAAVDEEYRRMVVTLRHGSQRRALLGAVAAAVGTGCGLLVLRSLLPEAEGLLPLAAGPDRINALGTLGGAIAVAALAWSGTRGVLPGLRLRP
jgi:anti-sigma factor RsiW